jgi:hypothetical protein
VNGRERTNCRSGGEGNGEGKGSSAYLANLLVHQQGEGGMPVCPLLGIGMTNDWDRTRHGRDVYHPKLVFLILSSSRLGSPAWESRISFPGECFVHAAFEGRANCTEGVGGDWEGCGPDIATRTTLCILYLPVASNTETGNIEKVLTLACTDNSTYSYLLPILIH